MHEKYKKKKKNQSEDERNWKQPTIYLYLNVFLYINTFDMSPSWEHRQNQPSHHALNIILKCNETHK